MAEYKNTFFRGLSVLDKDANERVLKALLCKRSRVAR